MHIYLHNFLAIYIPSPHGAHIETIYKYSLPSWLYTRFWFRPRPSPSSTRLLSLPIRRDLFPNIIIIIITIIIIVESSNNRLTIFDSSTVGFPNSRLFLPLEGHIPNNMNMLIIHLSMLDIDDIQRFHDGLTSANPSPDQQTRESPQNHTTIGTKTSSSGMASSLCYKGERSFSNMSRISYGIQMPSLISRTDALLQILKSFHDACTSILLASTHSKV